jgi:IS5 family transposase
VAHKTGALATRDLERVVVDTTVQPKNVAFPTDARLMHKAIVMLGRLAKKNEVPLRQSYVRVAKQAALMAGRYAHAKQFKRHDRQLKFLRTRLGRLVRDIRRKTDGDEALQAIFAIPLTRADQQRRQRQRQRGWKLYSLHAPEVECIGKGKARAPYEFSCKVSVATPVTKPKGGQFVLHAKALHERAALGLRPPYDGHTLGARHRPDGGAHRRGVAAHPCGQGLRSRDRSSVATAIRIKPGSGSPAGGAGSPRPSAGRCDAGPPSNR